MLYLPASSLLSSVFQTKTWRWIHVQFYTIYMLSAGFGSGMCMKCELSVVFESKMVDWPEKAFWYLPLRMKVKGTVSLRHGEFPLPWRPGVSTDHFLYTSPVGSLEVYFLNMILELMLLKDAYMVAKWAALWLRSPRVRDLWRLQGF